MAFPAAPIVARLFLASDLRSPPFLKVFFGTGAVIGMPLGDKFLENRTVTVEALSLIEWTLIIVQVQECHALENGGHGFGARALKIGIFYAQNELPLMATGIEP